MVATLSNRDQSWLSSLSSHPIFTLPELPPTPPPPPPPSHPSLSASELARPASPNLKPIFNPLAKSSAAIASSSRLPNGRKLTPAAGNKEEGDAPGLNKSRIALVRGTELVVAVGKQVRIASLVHVKGRVEGEDEWDSTTDFADDNVEIGEYKTLSTPIITFEIHSLVLSPTSKLLACIGLHSIAIVVLPRKGWTTSAVGPLIECRTLLVGRFYHSLPGSSKLAKVRWHPWGQGGMSLLVLTQDATLREYAIGEDAEEPVQTVSFADPNSSSSSASSSRGGVDRGIGSPGGSSFALSDDVEGRKAVGFEIGSGHPGSWGAFTLYCLMRNGDIYAMCPFIPKKAAIPCNYLLSLPTYITTKLDSLLSDPSTSSALLPSSTRSTSASAFSSHLSTLEGSYNLQLKYANSLVAQIPSARPHRNLLTADDDDDDANTSFATSTAGEENQVGEEDDEDEESRTVPIKAPRTAPPRRQGPFLLQPAPEELNNSLESNACDLLYTYHEHTGTSWQEGTGGGLGVLAVAYTDGKVDLLVEVEGIEPSWRNSGHSSAVVRRGGGVGDYGIDVNDVDDRDEDLPSLVVFETIDLGLDKVRGNRGLTSSNPSLVRDPLYPDTIYVYHALGAHCLLLSPWVEPLAAALSAGATSTAEMDDETIQKDLEQALKPGKGSEVVWILKTTGGADDDEKDETPVVGMGIINDVYLGYSALLVTSKLQPVGIELNLRVHRGEGATTTSAAEVINDILSASTSAVGSHKIVDGQPSPAYISLLDTPFSIPPSLSSTTSSTSITSRLGLKPPPGASKPLPDHPTKRELVVTPDTLRFLGKTVEAFRGEIRDLVSGANRVQGRLELQMKELARQVGKLNELARVTEDLRASTARGSGGGGGGGGVAGRLERVGGKQVELLSRLDRVLQRLMDVHEPLLSTYEKKWFAELGRLEREVVETVGGEGSLESRAERVKVQLEALRPGLEELKRRNQGSGSGNGKGAGGGGGGVLRGDGGLESPGGLGVTQVKKLENKLAEEAKMIAEARHKLDRLTAAALASSSLL